MDTVRAEPVRTDRDVEAIGFGMEVRSVVTLIPGPASYAVENLDERLVVLAGRVLQSEEDSRDDRDAGRPVSGDQLDVPALEESGPLMRPVITVRMQRRCQGRDRTPCTRHPRDHRHVTEAIGWPETAAQLSLSLLHVASAGMRLIPAAMMTAPEQKREPGMVKCCPTDSLGPDIGV